MIIFDHMNTNGEDGCLICGKKDDKPCTLIGVAGTESDGNIEARQVHIECIELFYYPEHNLIAQKLP